MRQKQGKEGAIAGRGRGERGETGRPNAGQKQGFARGAPRAVPTLPPPPPQLDYPALAADMELKSPLEIMDHVSEE